MEIEAGKTYVSDEYGITIEVCEANVNNIGAILCKVISTIDHSDYQVGKTYTFFKSNAIFKSLKPVNDTEIAEDLQLITKYDYIKLPPDTLHLSEFINDLLRIYNTVSIQKTADYYILQCERLEDE